MTCAEHRTFAFNGVNGSTGDFLLASATASEVARFARREAVGPNHLSDLRERQLAAKTSHLGLREGLDPRRLDEAGWGVVFADMDGERRESIRAQLAPLLQLRREQAGRLYKEFEGVFPGETKTDFLARHGMAPGPPSPGRVPYYLLLVAGPDQIPFVFQYELDVQYAVGRLQFDCLEDYGSYARAVVAAETGTCGRERSVSFVGVHNRGDRATQLSRTRLIEPLASYVEESRPDWAVQRRLAEQATKRDLLDTLSGTGSLLFAACHGVGFSSGDSRQRGYQGALLCQDWPGPLFWRKPIPPEFFVSAEDVGEVPGAPGLLAFFFACYSAGTPRDQDFAHGAVPSRLELAPEPFVARLPQRLLSHRGLGALAVVGHVDRAWSFSFAGEAQESQTAAFEDTLSRLLAGHPIGSAMEPLNLKYAELATVLVSRLEDIRRGRIAEDEWLAKAWTATNDARAYVVIGDPAVRLALAAPKSVTGSPAVGSGS